MKTAISNKRSSIIIDLQERGYDFDFVLKNGLLSCVQDSALTSPEGFEITEKHLIIDDSCLENTCVIYAVQLLDSNAKGILMASYHQGNHTKGGTGL
ncbi:hypothetical protein ABIC45_002915 [Mucilaginibacter rubeus]|uniref:hypothetical protein n=1 Tax=Mucilaginibacter rubeus TaxID=2027860 RepID=UPI00339135B6